MRLIRPTATILKPDPDLSPAEQMFQMIEVAGRTCYKSEDKITKDSASKFVDMLIAKGHNAMLEHGTVYLAMPSKDIPEGLNYFINYNPYVFWRRIFYKEKPYTYIVTNYRVIFENSAHQLLKYQISEEQFVLDTLSHLHRRVTARFICDRGVSHEFVRHRVFSFAQESTRFCNYSKNKFGNELTFILPCWMDNGLVGHYGQGDTGHYTVDKLCGDSAGLYLLHDFIDIEQTYLKLLNYGWAPQQARAVLPNATKTELVMTGTVDQWLGFFELRCALNAHPQVRELAMDLRQQFIDNNYIAKEDLSYETETD